MSAALSTSQSAETLIPLSSTVVVVDFQLARQPHSDLAKRLAAEAGSLKQADKANKQGGVRDLAIGTRTDIHRISPYDLNILPDFNCRDMTDPANLAHIDKLARSIAAGGVEQDLLIWWENGKAWVIDGHMRLLAVYRAIDEYGAAVISVPVRVKTYPKGYTIEEIRADRVATQHRANTGKALSHFELANNFVKLQSFGWDIARIANSAAMSGTRVLQMLELRAGANDTIKAMISSEQVSATFAWTTLHENGGDSDAAVAVLERAVKTANAAGRTKALPKDARERKPRLDRPQRMGLIGRMQIEDPDADTVVIRLKQADYRKLLAIVSR